MTTGKRRSARSTRKALLSPGRPPVARREHRRVFWSAIAAGRSSEDAAAHAGVSPPVGARWFREAGGMPPSQFSPSAKPPSGRHLSFVEREEIALLCAGGHGMLEIARRLSRAPSTISRELRRNAATRGGGLEYRATTAQWHADRSARRPKPAKLAVNARLRDYVQDRLAGRIAAPGGRDIRGPSVAWKGRRAGRRQDRRWAKAWSPEQIARRLRLDFPEDETMRVSHEAIYQSLYVQGRGALKRELTACLRTGRALRLPRSRLRGRGKSFVTPEAMISERPASRRPAVPGHWEEPDPRAGQLGDRHARPAHHALHDAAPSSPDARPRRRPARHERPRARRPCAEAVRDAIARTITMLPEQLRVADLGPGSGDVETRRPADRDRA